MNGEKYKRNQADLALVNDKIILVVGIPKKVLLSKQLAI